MSNKLNSIRDKEAKESYETDKQRTSNNKEAGIIGKRFFLVVIQLAVGRVPGGCPTFGYPSLLGTSYTI